MKAIYRKTRKLGVPRTLVPRRLLQIICATGFAMAGFGPGAFAAEDPMIGHVQRELQRQQFYTGKITNTLDEPTVEAVRRFQIRNGLKVTGELDGSTMALLAMADAPARERSQATVRDDVDLLRELEAEGTLPPAPAPTTSSQTRVQETRTTRRSPEPEAQVAPSSTIPGLADVPEPREPAPTVVPDRERRARAEEFLAERERAAAVTRNEPPASTTAPKRTSPERATLTRNDVLETIEDFVHAWHQPTPDRELSFYADAVDYYGQGKLSHAAITRDQQNYYRRWPEREFTLLATPQIVSLDDRGATVRYPYRYALKNGKKTASGRAEHFVRFQLQGDALKVVSVRERKIAK